LSELNLDLYSLDEIKSQSRVVSIPGIDIAVWVRPFTI